MTPGWYPDPFSDGFVRWWDGNAWTQFTRPNVPLAWGPNPHTDLASEERAGKRASLALVLGAVAYVAYFVLAALLFGNLFSDYFDELDRIDSFSDSSSSRQHLSSFFAQFALIWLASLALLAVQILLMIWLYHSATFARRAGLPAVRDPIWTILIFVVPVVGLWFPYQLARDAFPPDDPLRRCAARWWTWYLIQQFAFVPIVIVSFSSELVAVLIAVLACIAPILAAREGRVMIASALAAHRKLVPVVEEP